MVWNMATEHHQKLKERTQGYCGSQKGVTVASSSIVSRCAKVAWRKRELVRKIGTQENYGECKEFTTVTIKTTHYAKVAWRKECSHEGPLV
jgi:hypothetical protein